MQDHIELQKKVIDGDSSGPHLLITGGVHGDEFEPMAAIRRLIDLLSPEDVRGRVTLVPVVNEPAFLRGCRTAEDGLDLARVCPGEPGGSITHQVALALSELIRSADYYIDLHTGGTSLTILPLVGYMLHPDQRVLEEQRRIARAFNLPIIWGTDPSLNGRSLSVARDANVPGIYCEYRGGATCDPAGIDAYVTGCLNVMAELGMIDRPAPASAVQYAIEDERRESGHLQICNPAMITGFFEPAIRLGDHVNAGDLLGTVTNVLGTAHEPVRSRQSGIVIVLKTFARVHEGDSVAVILETERATVASLPEVVASSTV